MVFTNRVDEIDLDKIFGEVKSDIKTMDLKLQNLVPDNISMIGSCFDEYLASRYNDIANLKGGESMIIGPKLIADDALYGSIKSIDEFKLHYKESTYGSYLKFFISSTYRVNIDFDNLLGGDVSDKVISYMVKRLETYFSDIPNVDKIFIFGNTLCIYFDREKIVNNFNDDIRKFLTTYFDNREIHAFCHGYNDYHIYGFYNN